MIKKCIGCGSLLQTIDKNKEGYVSNKVYDKVEYCEQNRLDRMQAFSKSAKERFLYKNKDLAYQREYRLVIAHELPIDHFVRIGKLDNTKILETGDMREFKFSIGYISHQIGEEMI